MAEIYGTPNADVLYGSHSNDTISAGEGNDNVYANDGDDEIFGEGGNDLLSGDKDNDTLWGGDGADVLYGDLAMAGSVAGFSGADILYGGAGYDLIYGGGGADSLFGGADRDELTGGSGIDHIDGGEGNDHINGRDISGPGESDSDTLLGGAGDDVISAGFGDSVDGGVGNDILLLDFYDQTAAGVNIDLRPLADGGTMTIGGAQITNIEYIGRYSLTQLADTLIAGARPPGFDTVYIDGWGGNDDLTGSSGVDNIFGGEGNDVIRGNGGFDPSFTPSGDRLRGEAGDDVIYIGDDAAEAMGGDGNDTIRGGNGVDSIYGDFDNDLLYGGAGADGVNGGWGDDVVVGGAGADYLAGDDGIDTLDYSQETGGQGVYVNLRFGGMPGPGPNGFVPAQRAWDTYGNLETISGFENVVTGAGNDTVYGNAGANRFETGAGDDLLLGGGGADLMIGGSGNDTYWFQSQDFAGAPTGTIVELAGGGIDLVATTLASFSLAAIAEVENLTGYNDGGSTLTGNGLDNVITGGAGADSLDGGAGNDILVGGQGDDSYSGGEGTDTVDYSLEAGPVAVNLTANLFLFPAGHPHASRSLGPGEVLDGSGNYETLTGIENLILTGGNDRLVGSEGSNRVDSGAGNDNVDGAGGNDLLFGEAGNDRLSGDSGNDQLDGGADSDVLIGGAGQDSLAGGLGEDRLYSHGIDPAYTGPTSFIGTSYDIFADVDTLSGGGGDDYLFAGYGDNVDGGSSETFGDRLFISFRGAGSGVNADFRLLASQPSITIGGGTIAGIEYADFIEGSEHGDLLASYGSFHPGSTRVYGRGGDDQLIAHQYAGFGDGGFWGGEGNDTIDASQSQYGPALYGDSGDDTLIAGTGGSVVRGGTGNDILHLFNGGNQTALGGEGDDSFYFGQALNEFDRIDGGAGFDRLFISGGFPSVLTFAADTMVNVEQITLAAGFGYRLTMNDSNVAAGQSLAVDGSAIPAGLSLEFDGSAELDGAFKVTGGAGSDTIVGGSGADLIDGGAGDDGMTGGAGSDTYVVESAGDVVNELAGGGTDEVRTTLAAYTLAAEVENLRGLSSSGQALTGNGLNNFILGGAGADTIAGGGGNDAINGGAGADVMRGGTGDDVYAVDNAGDVVEEDAGEGTDTVVTLLATYSLLGTQVENLTAPSSSAYDLRGSTANNVITGGGGGDFIRLQDGGDDTGIGGGGNDVFLFGAALTSADQVNGGAGTDQIAIQGDYAGAKALTLGSNLLSVENIALLPGNDIRFGDPGTSFYDYSITVLDSAVASGVQMVLDANRLRVGEDFSFDGSAETDGSFFVYGGGGIDLLTGGALNDVFLFGAQGQWGSSDIVVGGAGTDQLALRGNYSLTFGAGQLVGIENIGLLSAHDTRFGALGSSYSYDLTMVDSNVAAGVQMVVDGAKLRIAEFFRFDGSAETDGSFRVFGGLVDDVITGGQNADLIQGNGGADSLTGNGGADVFRYLSASDSTATATDRILDFAAGSDKIDLSRIDADSSAAGDQAFSWIGSSAFSGSAGQLRAFQDGANWFVQGDTDGDGTADFVLILTPQGSTPPGTGDFVL